MEGGGGKGILYINDNIVAKDTWTLITVFICKHCHELINIA